MGFSEAVRTCLLQKYITFSGRASRSEFWWFMLFYALCMSVLVLIIVLSLGSFGYGQPIDSFLGGGSTALFVVVGLMFVALYIPVLAATVRRFHDRDLSGWWVLGLIVLGNVPYVGIAASIGMLVIQVLKGTEGRNRFGDDPLQTTVSADVFA